MMEPAAGEGDPLRANLRLGAFTLARLQLGVFLALGCERIVCLAPAADEHVDALQTATEAVGANFHLVAEPRALIGLVTAIDEVVALGDGLLAWPQTAMALLNAGSAVVVQPIEAGLEAGFERLDLNHADAGAFRIPGRLIPRLAELPADCDGFSALQRIALQAGVRQRAMPAAALAEQRWTLVRSEAEAQAAEAHWIRLQTDVSDSDNASLLVAQWAVRRLGAALLHAGSGNRVVALATAVTAMLALVAGHFQWMAAAFVLAGFAWLLFCAAGLLARVERETLHLPAPRILRDVSFSGVLGWLADGILALLIVEGIAFIPGQNGISRAFAPVMLLGLCRFVPQGLARRWSRWLEDRGVLAIVLAGLAGAGMLETGIQVLAILLLAAGIWCASRQSIEAETD